MFEEATENPQQTGKTLPPFRATSFGVIVTAVVIMTIILSALALKALGTILRPLVIAVFLYYLFNPLVSHFARRRVPRIVSYAVLLAVFSFIILGMGKLVAKDFRGFYGNMPTYEAKLVEVFRNFLDDFRRTRYGFLIGPDTENDVLVIQSAVQKFVMALLDFFYGTSVTYAGNIIAILVFFIFLVIEAQTLDGRLKKAFGKENAEKLDVVLNNINTSIYKYLMVKTLISLMTALCAGLILSLFDIEFRTLWTILTFVLNFIPYIGSIIATVLPLLLALVQLGLSQTLLLLLFLWLNQLWWGSILDPKLAGSTLNLSPIVIILLMGVWGYIWGAVGVVVAVPITVSIKLVLLNFETTRPLAFLISSSDKD